MQRNKLKDICDVIFKEAEERLGACFYFYIQGIESIFTDEYTGYENSYSIVENRLEGTETIGKISCNARFSQLIISVYNDHKRSEVTLKIPYKLIQKYMDIIIAFLKTGYCIDQEIQ